MKKTDLSKTLGILAVSSAMFVGGYSKAETGASGSAPEVFSGNTSGATIIKGTLSKNKTYEGDVVIKGDVLPGATLRIVNGGLKVEGSVGDRATIIQTDRSESGVVISNSRVIINGQEVTPSTAAGRLFGVKIDGQIGEGATIESTSSITAAGVLGNNASLKAWNWVTFADSEENCRVEAGKSVATPGKIEAKCAIIAAGSVIAKKIGAGASVLAGNDVSADSVDESAIVRAGNDVRVQGKIGRDASITAGNSIIASCADDIGTRTMLTAGNGVNAPACP